MSGKKYFQSVLTGMVLGILLAGIFGAGFFFRDFIDSQRINTYQDKSLDYPLLREVQTVIDSIFLREQPSETQREYAAIRGMLSELGDKNTFFIDPPVAQSESDVLSGTYGGIGVALKRNEKGEIELYPFDDSPANQRGVIAGSILVAVNGVLITLEDQQDAVDQLLRGEVKEGSGVEITIRPPKTNTDKTVFIEFAVINIPSVVWRVLAEDERIGYVQLIRFTNRTPDELKQALNDLKTQSIQAIVLDLRNNGGGLLQESIVVASQFLGNGVIAYEVSRDGETAYPVIEGGLTTALPMAVLVNSRTASASELVAGAIRDRERGILIGQTTYGKGTVQQIYPLSDGSSVHVTFAEWLPPSKISLEGIGLSPDISMIPDANGRDVELGEAIRYLTKSLE
jgi:carboxyl-terminal processing protease